MKLRKVALWAAGLAAGAWFGERALGVVAPFPLAALELRAASRQVFAADGTLLCALPDAHGERRLPVRLAEVSPHVVAALVAAEDRRFFAHGGVDAAAVLRAALQNCARGRVFSGASTLSMQVARLAEPHARTFAGKVWEAVRARQLERAASKPQILELYLNHVPFGGTLRGIEAASLSWYGKRARDLALDEAATLIAMLPAPTRRSPARDPALLRAARNQVLAAMVAAGRVSASAAAAAAALPLLARRHAWPRLAPHACALLLARSPAPELRSAIDLDLQRSIEDIVAREQELSTDGLAIVVLARESGDLVALCGSRDQAATGLDATRCARSAGSTLKPFLYAEALEQGVIGERTLLADQPRQWGEYRPENFGREFAGRLMVADALAESRNLPAVALLEAVGVDAFRARLHACGLELPRRRLHLDAALGTVAVTPLALGAAYVQLLRSDALSPGTRATLLAALSARSPAPEQVAAGLAACKTGTSSDRRDAWAVGVTPRHVVVVWAGDLGGRPAPGLVGSRAAAALLAPVLGALGG